MLIAAEKPAEIAVGEASVKRSSGERLFFAGGIAVQVMRVKKRD
jgi:hypothetical protein